MKFQRLQASIIRLSFFVLVISLILWDFSDWNVSGTPLPEISFKASIR